MNKKIIKNISWVFIFLFIYQWCGVKLIYAVDTSQELEIRENDPGVAGKLNEFINAKISEGYTKFYIRNGNYELDNTLNINATGVTIRGESKTGTIIKQTKKFVSIKINQNNITVNNLTIDGSLGMEVFHAQKVDGVKLINCLIKGAKDYTTIVFLGQDVSLNSNNVIKGNEIYAGIGMGESIWFLNQSIGDVSDNTVYKGTMHFETCKNTIIDNNTIENSIKSGIRFSLPGESISITNNTVKNSYDSGIAVISGSSTKYKNIKIQNNTITKTAYFGIEVNNLDGGIVSDNTISETDYYGIYLLRSDKLDVENNEILNCEIYKGSLPPRWPPSPPIIKAGIYLESDVQNSKILNNIIKNDSEYPCEYGIRSQSGQNNEGNTLFNNKIDGFTTLTSVNIGSDEFVIDIVRITENIISIKWQELSNTTEYDLEEDGHIVVPTVGTNNIYENTGLLPEKEHSYRVRIKDSGKWSEIIKIKTLSPSPPPVTIPQNIRTTHTNGTSSSKRKKTKYTDVEYDKVEVYFGNKKNFIYNNPLFENVQVDVLNRIFICKFEENYYLNIRAWKNNKVKIETEYKLNLTQGKSLTFNKIENKINDQSYQINEISIQDTDENLFYASDFENITLSKCILGNGYMIWLDDIKIKIKENEKYTISKRFII